MLGAYSNEYMCCEQSAMQTGFSVVHLLAGRDVTDATGVQYA